MPKKIEFNLEKFKEFLDIDCSHLKLDKKGFIYQETTNLILEKSKRYLIKGDIKDA